MAAGNWKVKPVLPTGAKPSPNVPAILDEPKIPDKIVFSFRFYQEQEYFGLDQVSASWFASLLERLAELSKMNRDDFLSDTQLRDTLRYHAIKWSSKNIPIQRSDLTSLPAIYLNDPDNYPLYQFHISKAMGRVVGIWDENRVFNIVLLDPHHNIQPSKRVGYAVTQCDPLGSEFENLKRNIFELVNNQTNCSDASCSVKTQVRALVPIRQDFGVFYLELEDFNKANQLVSDGIFTNIAEILSYGMMAFGYGSKSDIQNNPN